MTEYDGVERSTTERLRELLDKRGVEWWPMHDVESGYYEDRDTEFLVYGCKHVAHEWGCKLQVDMLTPEQAVEATLGRGTCRMEYVSDWMGWHCLCCDNLRQGLRDQKPRFCPDCGRRVAE